MHEGDMIKQAQAYDAAAEAHDALKASRERAQAIVDRIPDEHIARAGGILTRSLMNRLDRLHGLQSSAMRHVEFSQSKVRGVDDATTTTIRFDHGARVDISKHQTGDSVQESADYAVTLQDREAPGNVATEIGGSELGGVDSSRAGNGFASNSHDYDRERLAEAVELAETVDTLEKRVGLDEPPTPKSPEDATDEAWLEGVLSTAYMQPAA